MIHANAFQLFAAVAAGAAACGYSAVQFVRARISRSWPTVDGEVAESRLVERRDHDGDAVEFEYVSYRYRVRDRPYRNDRVRFGPQVAPASFLPRFDPEPDDLPDEKSALDARYPRGKHVVVRYNPREPADSVLHAEVNVGAWALLVGGALIEIVVFWGR